MSSLGIREGLIAADAYFRRNGTFEQIVALRRARKRADIREQQYVEALDEVLAEEINESDEE